MRNPLWQQIVLWAMFVAILFAATLASAIGPGASPLNASAPPTTYTVTVTLAGSSTGTVTSNPAGINCGSTCTASFASGTRVRLTPTPGTGAFFDGWSGACTGLTACTVLMNKNATVTATFNVSQTVKVLNHIIFMAQENRSLDHYFGALRSYWKNNGFADRSFDGLPQFNPTSGLAPLYGPPPTNPGCDPNYPPPAQCKFDSNSPTVTSYQLITECIETPNPSWNASHQEWNQQNPVSGTPLLNGYAWASAQKGRNANFYDTDGIRAMGYYDDSSLNYYYYMASQFATSDRWFSPVMTRTSPNREYLLSGTSQGYVYPVGTNSHDQNLLTATPIFEELQNAGISWKIYVDTDYTSCSSNPTPQCLLTLSYIANFQWGQTIPTNYPNNIATITQYLSDVQNGTLPQVALIEPASAASLDEHPSDSDLYTVDIQAGANFVSTLINPLMTSSSWKDSVFILSYDEAGGLYDHVPAHKAVAPDNILSPLDLNPEDVCTSTTGPTCDFTYTGYRIPLIVVSPYTKKHFVDHTVADYTAILKLIETRFNLAPLTKRDAAQPDMTEFFNFNFPPWLTPPSPPVQSQSEPCYLNSLP
jgi:phospholipase C